MKMFLTGVVAGIAVTLVTLMLLLLAAYTLRMPPEVVNCDRGRQSVEVRVTNAPADSDTGVVRDRFLRCNVWYHVQDIEDVRSYREGGKVKQEVVHLGEHATADKALTAWPTEVQELERIGRPRKADKLRAKIEKLQALS